MEINSSNTPSANDALAAVSAARAKLATEPRTPWWFKPGLGACVAVMMLTASDQLPRMWLPLAIIAMTGLSIVATKSHGMEPRQLSALWKSPRGIAVLAAFIASVIACIFASSMAGNHHNQILGWASAAAAFLLWVAFGFASETIWRQHLHAQA